MYIHSKQFSAFKPYTKGDAFLAPSTIYLPVPSEYVMVPPYFLERASSYGQSETFEN
jgi:hypothetical protein